VIRTEAEYQKAFDRAELLVPLCESGDGDACRALESLAHTISDYEDEHYPMDKPSLLARLAFWWDQRGRWKLRRLWLFGKRGWQ